jgi:multicomponent Na+:H+ antiporter subunit D
MSYIHFPVIAVMTLFMGAFLTVVLGRHSKGVRSFIALAASCVSFALIAMLVKPVMIDGEIISYWMGNWAPMSGYAIGIGYEVDQLGLFFALLVVTTILLSAVYSIRYIEKDSSQDFYYVLFLMLSGSVLGLVMTGDVFNMFIMIEIMTFTAVGLTAFRNTSFGAVEAGFKYLVIGSIGSSFTLFGIAVLYGQCHTLNMAQLSAMLYGNHSPATLMAFALMFTGLAVKSYIVPFHTPAADAYTTAPSSISMVFSGMVNKAGVYGMIRLVYIIFRTVDMPSVQTLIVLFGTVTMFIGVTMALAQHDFKRLLAFHSISQIGYVITAAGLCTSLGLSAGLFHAMNHTLFKGLLFLCAGAVLRSTGTTNLDQLGGLSKRMPKTTLCFLVGAFSISGLPPFNGFASKWLVYQAAYEKAVTTGNIFYAFVTVTAVVVSVMTLASFIKVTQAAFFGQLPARLADVEEAPGLMLLPMYIMSLLCVGTGIFYDKVYQYLLDPAVRAAFTVSNYIDRMMGDGYAEAAGVEDVFASNPHFSYWNPVIWLALFVIVFCAAYICVVTSKGSRGQILSDEGGAEDGKYATFFSGEKALPSHVAGSDLFWGFKTDWKGYFRVMEGLHSGIVNDYALYVVAAAAFVVVFTFAFLR